VFVDTDPRTKLIDVSKIEEKITERTRAIVPVHLYGQMCDMPAIAEIAKKHDPFVVEDCAQAIDAAGDGFKLGEHSDAVCLSFIVQKNLGTFGDGGAVATPHEYVDQRIRALRNHGSTARSKHSMGYNSRLDDLHAGILSVKLKYITQWSDRRRALAAQYSEKLADTGLELAYEIPGYRHVFHLYVVETERRDDLLGFLQDSGIDAKTHYPIAIHQQEGYPWGQPADMTSTCPTRRATQPGV